jgi:hypothetical protein
MSVMTEEEIRYDERKRCAKLICSDCAAGLPIDDHGDHVLETIQGYAVHTRVCRALVLFRSDTSAEGA